ncbi:MAG: hypothetical protein WC312_00695 [Candidatus Omnitrophota bacterium]|jgi:Tfp pilus assembly protein PilX
MNIYNNKGVAIFISLALLFLLSAAAIAVLLTTYNYNSICEGQIKRLKAMVSAEAGINYAYWKLGPNTDEPGYSGSTITVGGTDVVITISGPVSGRYTITSKAEYQKISAP